MVSDYCYNPLQQEDKFRDVGALSTELREQMAVQAGLEPANLALRKRPIIQLIFRTRGGAGWRAWKGSNLQPPDS